MFAALMNKLQESEFQNTLQINQEVKDWVFDVYLDKWYETDAKIKGFMMDLGFNISSMSVDKIRQRAESLIFENYIYPFQVNNTMEAVRVSVEEYQAATEKAMNLIRQKMYETDWNQVKKLKSVDYILPIQRKKYVSAREELEKAKQAVRDNQWSEVLNHLRPAIDLALREKLGYSKIHPMYQFLKKADELNLPLPSYTMLYDYFSEGTGRIHGGQLNTPFECQKALEFVADFIDRLEVMNIPIEQIEEFKQSCNCVE